MIICVTGAMAAGKNAAAAMIEEAGFYSLDFDSVAHDVIDSIKAKILEAFSDVARSRGLNILDSGGNIDRRALGALLFSDKKLLEKQEDLLYPAITERALEFIKKNSKIAASNVTGGDGAGAPKNTFNTAACKVVLNATLLYKTPELLALCDRVIFIKTNIITRLIRVKKRDNLSLLQVARRFYAQRNLLASYKDAVKALPSCKLIIIKNNGTVAQLAKRLKKAIE